MAGTVVVPVEAMGAVEFFAYVFVGLGSVITLSAFDIGESREAQYGHEPQQHYDNLAAHGLGLRCLHCKYNNNVHTRKGNRGKSDGWWRKSYDAACPRPKLLIRIMEVIIFIETIPVTPTYSNALDKGFSTAVMIQVQQNSIIE